jgi:hypothetical protein
MSEENLATAPVEGGQQSDSGYEQLPSAPQAEPTQTTHNVTGKTKPKAYDEDDPFKGSAFDPNVEYKLDEDLLNADDEYENGNIQKPEEKPQPEAPRPSSLNPDEPLFGDLEQKQAGLMYAEFVGNSEFQDYLRSNGDFFEELARDAEVTFGLDLVTPQMREYLSESLGASTGELLAAMAFDGIDVFGIFQPYYDIHAKQAEKTAPLKPEEKQVVDTVLSRLNLTYEKLATYPDEVLEKIVDLYLEYDFGDDSPVAPDVPTDEDGFAKRDRKAIGLKPVGKNEKGQPLYRKSDLDSLSDEDWETYSDKIVELYKRGLVIK